MQKSKPSRQIETGRFIQKEVKLRDKSLLGMQGDHAGMVRQAE